MSIDEENLKLDTPLDNSVEIESNDAAAQTIQVECGEQESPAQAEEQNTPVQVKEQDTPNQTQNAEQAKPQKSKASKIILNVVLVALIALGIL